MRHARVYIAYIEISQAMVEKLASKHGVAEDEVRDAFQLPSKPQRGVWHNDPERGRRLFEGVTFAMAGTGPVPLLHNRQIDQSRSWPS